MKGSVGKRSGRLMPSVVSDRAIDTCADTERAEDACLYATVSSYARRGAYVRERRIDMMVARRVGR